MPSRIDEAGHTKAFDYLVAELRMHDSELRQFLGISGIQPSIGLQ